MDLDPNHLEAISNAVPESTREKLLNPSAKIIGDSIAGILGKVFRPLQEWKIVNEHHLEEFKDNIYNNLSQIPEDNRDASKLELVLKAFEEAKYQLDEKELRNYFSNLISSSVDNRKNSAITPRFATVLSQLGKDEATILKKLNSQDRQATLGFLSLVDTQNKQVSKITPTTLVWNRSDYKLDLEKSLDILTSLGVITINYDRKIPGELYNIQVNQLKEFLVSTYGVNFQLSETQSFSFSYGVISCTDFGKKLLDVIL